MLNHKLEHLDFIRLTNVDSAIKTLCNQKIKVAVLADFSSQHLSIILKNILLLNKIDASIHEAEFDAMEANIYNLNSPLYIFNPDFLILLNSSQKLRERYYSSQCLPKVFIQDETDRIISKWLAFREKSNASIIQSNFVVPYERIYGNLDITTESSLRFCATQINEQIAFNVPKNVSLFLNDLEYIASYFGKQRWFDEKIWVSAKYFCSLDILPHVTQSLADTILSQIGLTIKCIILDLDDTLWGGLIGEDGLEGIRLGHLGDGEAFQLFQKYLLRLKQRGLILVVCSKNDIKNALLPFRSHPEMVLKEEDITLFVANWDSKVDNIRKIQATLNIGYDSMIFLDDSEFERRLVKDCLPGVIVPDLPADAAEYVKTLSELNLFEAIIPSTSDESRSILYREEFQRKNEEKKFSDHPAYLKSLNMTITISRFDTLDLPRIVELIQRSNQFNLMTRRFNEASCHQFMNASDHYPFYVSLSDKYGNNGLISVVILKLNSADITILEWVMSCRVLNRGVEDHAMNYIVNFAQHRGFKKIFGDFVCTPKNSLVSGFYEKFCFEKISTNSENTSTWCLELNSYIPKQVFFETAINPFL